MSKWSGFNWQAARNAAAISLVTQMFGISGPGGVSEQGNCVVSQSDVSDCFVEISEAFIQGFSL
jgi:hypothetical protein